jgi:hypothetical protein
MPADFYYKGLPVENEFFPFTPEQSAEEAKGSMYEAWFDALKTSPWYNDICETRVFPSDAAKECYENFGDLRPFSFKKWWLDTGYKIFAERVRYEGMQDRGIVNGATKTFKYKKGENDPNKLLIEVPLNLDPRKLREQFEEILRQHSAYYEHKNRFEESTAPVPLDRDSKLSYNVIKSWLHVYKEVEKERALHKDATLADICQKIGLRKHLFADFGDGTVVDQPVRQQAANAVSEYYQKARRLMAHATEMTFPCVDDRSALLDIRPRNRH